NADGVDVKPQVLGRPTGLIASWQGTFHPFVRTPSYARLAELPFAQRVNELSRPEVRDAIVAEAAAHPAAVRATFSNFFFLADPPNYEPDPDTSIEHEAGRRGVDPLTLIYDHLLDNGGRGQLLCCVGNYAEGTLDPALEMIRFPGSLPGLGDGGAHSTLVCDA